MMLAVQLLGLWLLLSVLTAVPICALCRGSELGEPEPAPMPWSGG